MAVTVTKPAIKRQSIGGYAMVYRTITFDASYIPGGEVVTAADFGLRVIKAPNFACILAGFAAGFAHVDPLLQADGSIKLRLRAAAGTEVPNATDVSTVSALVGVLGY